MNTSRFYKYIVATAFVGAPLLWSACSDAWDDHYNATQGGMSSQPTLLDNIKADNDLSEFCRVLEAIKADKELSSTQQLTIWAPRTLNADSIIAVYQADEAKGVKWEDNKAVTQFFKNHTAQYSRIISSMTNDTIKMMNNKYMHLKGISATQGTLNDKSFGDAVISSNGMLYKMDDVLRFFPNVRELLSQRTGLDSIASAIEQFDEYELNENASVPGGIVDGKTVYLDSVTTLRNDLLSRYGYIQREDSIYTFIAPTNDIWESEYARYSKYFKYEPKTVQNGDSLSDANTRESILCGRFFNTNYSNHYNRHPEDSLVNTMYYERQSHNPRTDVYYDPNNNLFSGLEKIECSNGYVYVDNKGAIDPRTTFLTRNDYYAYYAQYYRNDLPKNTKGEETMVIDNSQSYYVYDAEDETKIVKTFRYTQVNPVSQLDNATITFALPNTMSSIYYNIYVVTVPAPRTSKDANLPCLFQVRSAQRNDNGNIVDGDWYTNPIPLTGTEDIPNWDKLYPNIANSQKCFVSSGEKADTVLIQSAVQFNYSSYGLSDPVVKLTIQSTGPTSGVYTGYYSRTLRLNEIIFVPFESEDKAKADAQRAVGVDGLPHYLFDDDYLENYEKNKNVE